MTKNNGTFVTNINHKILDKKGPLNFPQNMTYI